MKKFSNLYRKFFANRFCYKWNRFLLTCSLKGLGINNFGDDVSGELHLLKEVIGSLNSPVLFDVGANIGSWSQAALSINPTSQIYAFEPGEKPFKTLSQIHQIKSFAIACGSKNEEGFLFDRMDKPNSVHASLDYHVVGRLEKGVIKQAVKVVPLDEIIARENIKKIDLLKIDVEGHEYEVLLGAKNALANGIINSIQFEFNEMNVYRKRFFRDFYDLLPDFDFFRLLPKGRIPLRKYDSNLHEIFSYQNLLVTRRSASKN